LDSGRKQKSLLADRISELEMAAVAGEGELRRAREELEALQVCVFGGGCLGKGGELLFYGGGVTQWLRTECMIT
jgi:hypothetical protein